MVKIDKIYKLFDPEIRKKNINEFRYWLKGVRWEFMRPEMLDPLFILGCSRSGTTVTFETIRQSKHLSSFGYELPQFWNGLWGPKDNNWESEAANAEHASKNHRNTAFKYFYQRLGSIERVLDKTCINTMRVSYLKELFPKAHFIYIHRDGRDTVSSLMEGWKLGEHFTLEKYLGTLPCAVDIDQGKFKQWCFFLPPGWEKLNNASLEEVCAYQWITANQMALDSKKLIPKAQWVQIRYEDIFTNPIEMFETIFTRLDLPFENHIRSRVENLTKHPTSIVKGKPAPAKWKTQNPEAINRILDKISPMMKTLGYF